MAKVRILKRQNSSYIELPPELANYEEIELFQLKDGYYLLTIPLEQPKQQPSSQQTKQQQEWKSQKTKIEISERERSILKKLLLIRFENRTPAYVNKALSEQEKIVLKELENKGLVNVFRGKKYKDGVYNISDSIYSLVFQKEKATERSLSAPSSPVPQQPQISGSSGLLRSQGFLILADKNEAKDLSDRLNQEMKSGAVVGVKGFDGKFYVVTRSYFNKAQAVISSVLKEDMSSDSIALASKLDPEGCRAVLQLMAENGEIIEKRKGVFAIV